MMAPVIFFLFLNSFGTLVIGDHHLTTLIFDEPVVRAHHGMSKSDLYLERSPDGKMLFIKALGKKIDTNLSVPTVSGKLYSFRVKTGRIAHSIVRIKDGKKDTLFKTVFVKNSIEIEEGKHSLRLFNNRAKKITVNMMGIPSKGKIELPKGPAVYVNGRRFYK